jgi:hypothetical protein
MIWGTGYYGEELPIEATRTHHPYSHTSPGGVKYHLLDDTGREIRVFALEQ